MKKSRIHAMLVAALCILMCFAFVGCGKEDKKASSVISKADYVGMLGDTFGYDSFVAENAIFSDVKSSDKNYAQIQACSEWGVIEDSGKFSPSDDVTLDYALESAVRAIRTKYIEKSGTAVDVDSLVEFFADNIADIDISKKDRTISESTAKEIIDCAIKYRNTLELKQVYDAKYKDSVKQVKSGVLLSEDGSTGEITDGTAYKTGDIIYIEGDGTTLPIVAKITSINGQTFTYDIPKTEDVYEDLTITGTYDGKIMNVTPANDGTDVNFATSLYNKTKNYGVSYIESNQNNILTANGIKTEKGDDYARFTASISGSTDIKGADANGSATFTVEVKNFKTTVDYEMLKSISASVSFDTAITGNVKGAISKSVPLGEIDIKISGPLFLRLSLTANFGANGEMTLSYNTSTEFSAQWEKGKGLGKNVSCSPRIDFDSDVTLTAEATALADVRLGYKIFKKDFSESLLNAQITSGVVANCETKANLLDNEPACTDVLVYVPLRWGINQESCMITKVASSLKYKATVWDSTNSPLSMHFHFENGKRTAGDECNRGKGKEVVQEETDEFGNPFDELKFFDFKMIEFDFLKVEKGAINMGEKESATIKIAQLPAGYKESDIVYEVKDSSVCSAANGVVTAKKPGSTIVTLRTKDGLYSAAVAVTVFEDYSKINFKPI